MPPGALKHNECTGGAQCVWDGIVIPRAGAAWSICQKLCRTVPCERQSPSPGAFRCSGTIFDPRAAPSWCCRCKRCPWWQRKQLTLETSQAFLQKLRKRNLQVSNGMVVAVNTTLVAVEALRIKIFAHHGTKSMWSRRVKIFSVNGAGIPTDSATQTCRM